MAQLNVSPQSSTTIKWSITGLSANWNTTNYQTAILSTGANATGTIIHTQTPTVSTGGDTFTLSPVIGGGSFSAGNRYILYGTMRNASGSLSGVGSVDFTMPLPPVPDALSNLTVSASGYSPSTTVDATWNSSTGATGYRWVTNASIDDGITSGQVTTTEKSITVTSPVGGYQFTVTPYNSSGDGTGLTKSFSVTNPPLPNALTGLEISVSGNAPSASVTATWNSSSGATQYNWSTTATTIDGITNGAVTSTSKSITVTTAGTFNITVYPNNIAGNGTPSSKAFDVTRPRPPSFKWTYSGCSLTPPFAPIPVNPNDPTKDHTKGFYASAKEWNDLIARVLEFLDYKGKPNFNYNSAVSGVRPSATQFNQVRDAIATMNSSGLPSRKDAGNPITSADFNALRSCLNAIN
ncbi:hypothetical protein [Cohnella herbarum]|uniref:Fibronectin type-III domain-containing protein n=1 Tax=Cohnella herbarum TaxID=2728023 RepID=A0A7Z2VJ36_9BACL|nr:hypothetical protein [Cohnella herbarum]QJD83994.1 hypothetical protein HH215_12915 [Cohnella herbarum]